MSPVVVLLSGGVDSTVLLAHELDRGNDVLAVTFDYGQTHRCEIDAAQSVARYYDVVQWVIPLRCLWGSALTGEGSIPATHAEAVDATYVPGRNIVMIAIGASIAERERAHAVLLGANAEDAAGYPDCRPKFIAGMDLAVGLGTACGISVHAPFAHLAKSDIVMHGKELEVPFHLTWSCYRGGDAPCGACGACQANERAGL